MADWCELPWPALDLIAKTLTFYLDYIHFRSVCHSWRSAVPRRPYLPLLAGHRFDDNRLFATFNFFEFSGSGIFPVAGGHQLPEASLGRICCGSSHGWMAFLDPNLNIDLWNPLTKSHIALPHLATGFPNTDFSSVAGRKYRLSHNDGGVYKEIACLDLTNLKKLLASKVILSSNPSVDPSCVALLLPQFARRLSICRIGDGAWTPVWCHQISGLTIDAVFYKGRFHIASDRALYMLNVGGPKPKLERILMSNPPYDEGPCLPGISLCYLVESSGDLLLVNAYNKGSLPANVYHRDLLPLASEDYSFEVYKVDWGMHRIKLLKLRSLGDRALFLGLNHSFSLRTNDLLGCRSNCFYMAESYDRDGTNIWMYDMEDGGRRPIRSADRSSLSLPCTWITPSLLQ